MLDNRSMARLSKMGNFGFGCCAAEWMHLKFLRKTLGALRGCLVPVAEWTLPLFSCQTWCSCKTSPWKLWGLPLCRGETWSASSARSVRWGSSRSGTWQCTCTLTLENAPSSVPTATGRSQTAPTCASTCCFMPGMSPEAECGVRHRCGTVTEPFFWGEREHALHAWRLEIQE